MESLAWCCIRGGSGDKDQCPFCGANPVRRLCSLLPAPVLCFRPSWSDGADWHACLAATLALALPRYFESAEGLCRFYDGSSLPDRPVLSWSLVLCSSLVLSVCDDDYGSATHFNHSSCHWINASLCGGPKARSRIALN